MEHPAEPPVNVSQPETEPPLPTQTQTAPAPTPASTPVERLPDAPDADMVAATATAEEDPSKRKAPEGVSEEKPPPAKAAKSKSAPAEAAPQEPKAVSA